MPVAQGLTRIRSKLSGLFLLFGVVPALVIYGFYYANTDTFERAFREPIRQSAVAIGDTIDRNLFERYGDVQAFGLNVAALEPANWRRPDAGNPLVRAMNGYMTGYGIYRLMLLLDTEGKVLAVNGVDSRGKALETASIYQQDFKTASWFRKAMAGEFLKGPTGLSGTVVEQPARNAIVAKLYGDDGYTLTFAAPVKNAEGRTIGVWANFASFGLVEEIVATFHKELAAQGMANAELTVLDDKGFVLVDYDPKAQGWTSYKRNPDVVGKLNLATAGVESAVAAVAGRTGSMDSVHARKKIVQASGFAHADGAYGYPGLGWSILVRVPVEEAYAAVESVGLAMSIAIAVGTVAILLAGLAIGTLAARPIRSMTRTMTGLAGGDTDVEVPALSRKDEIGEMAQAVQVFKENALEKRRLEAEQVAAEQRAAAEKRRAMNELADSFEAAVRGIVDTVASAATELQSAAQAMSSAAEQTNSQATTVAAAAEQASANVQTVAAAAEELAATVTEIGNQVAESARISGEAVAEAGATNAFVRGLSASAQKIGEVVQLITAIAEQTNLLALNATIEAARAGDAGKGFAVVATEVKSLASQTAMATDEIAAQIGEVQSATRKAVDAIDGIGVTIGRMSEIASGVASAVEEQGAATQEITRNTQEAANGTTEVSSNIQGVSQAAAQAGAASAQVLTSAGELSQLAEKLRAEVDSFVAGIRAA